MMVKNVMRPLQERIAAIAAGENFYFTGKPCKNGHITKRYVVDNRCAACASHASMRSATKRLSWHPARTEANTAGRTRYSTGEPCEHGHLAERMVSSGQCVACKDASHQRWHENHAGEEARWARERRAKDPTGHRAEVKRWAEKNPERVKQIMKRWEEANPGRKTILHKQWRKANADLVRAYNRDRMRLRRGLRGNPNGGSYTDADIDAIRERQGNLCAVCRVAKKLEIDHIVAITKGGTNRPSNIQLLCRSCNSSKHNSDFSEWLSAKGYTVASVVSS